MKRILIFSILIMVLTAMPVHGQATGWNINGQPTSDWFSTNNGPRNVPLMWMRAVDPLIATVGGNIGTGKIWYVDSNVSNEGDGSSWTNAYDTIQEAVDASEADGGDNRGDTVNIAQGHAETVASAAAVDIDVPGILIWGCGNGEDQPEFSLSANLSTFQISAADVTLYNLRFLSTKTAGGVAQGIDVTADGDGFRMIKCEMRETSVDTEFVKALNLTADTDECVIVFNRFIFFADGTGGDSVAITLEGGSDQSVIAYNQFNGDWSGYVIDGTAAQSLNLIVEGNVIHNYDIGAGKIMGFHATTTGDIVGNRCYGNGTSFEIVADAMLVSPDNIVMQTENVEGRNYESMLGAFTGPVSGTAQDDNIKASLDLAHTDLDAVLADTAAMDTEAEWSDLSSTVVDDIVSAMDANGLLVNWTAARAAIVTDLAGISEIGDKIVADMDANGLLVNWTAGRAAILTDLGGISEIGDKVVADMDANSTSFYWQEKSISKTLVAFATPTNNLFDVDGGPILITSFTGICTEIVDANIMTLQITNDADNSMTDTQFSTAVACENDVVGTIYIFTNANPSVLTPLVTGTTEGATNLMMPWVCKEGMIECAASAANLDGTIIWYMTYKPMTAGVTVTAQ